MVRRPSRRVGRSIQTELLDVLVPERRIKGSIKKSVTLYTSYSYLTKR